MNTPLPVRVSTHELDMSNLQLTIITQEQRTKAAREFHGKQQAYANLLARTLEVLAQSQQQMIEHHMQIHGLLEDLQMQVDDVLHGHTPRIRLDESGQKEAEAAKK